MTDYWLIRYKRGVSYIWKRKYFLGLFAIPWSLHGGTNTIRTPDVHENTIFAAIEYIEAQSSYPNITIQYEREY